MVVACGVGYKIHAAGIKAAQGVSRPWFRRAIDLIHFWFDVVPRRTNGWAPPIDVQELCRVR
jgi:hypothetical protein